MNPCPKVIKLFPCSTQLSRKFPLLIKTKIPTNIEVSCFKSLRYCILKPKRYVDFHGTVSFDPVKMSQQKINQNVYQMPDTQELVII